MRIGQRVRIYKTRDYRNQAVPDGTVGRLVKIEPGTRYCIVDIRGSGFIGWGCGGDAPSDQCLYVDIDCVLHAESDIVESMIALYEK